MGVGFDRAARAAALLVPLALVVPCAHAQDVPFLETPEAVVEAMLDLAEVGAEDVVYDLGSGDGRIVIAAARRGARGVGIESDPALVARSEENARTAGVEPRARFVHGDLFEADVREATVVAIYLNPKVNRRLGPRLAEQLAPGTRIVSHKYEIGAFDAAKRVKAAGRTLFLYVVPGPSRAAAGRAGAVAAVAGVLDDWHRAAAEADGARYFGHFAADGVFLGTDATERWTLDEFRAYADPHFSQGHGWTFRPHDRHVGLSADGALAWVDEQLDSDKYGLLRGTGVLRRTDGGWKLVHYSMSFTIPNDRTLDAVAVIRGSDEQVARP